MSYDLIPSHARRAHSLSRTPPESGCVSGIVVGAGIPLRSHRAELGLCPHTEAERENWKQLALQPLQRGKDMHLNS